MFAGICPAAPLLSTSSHPPHKQRPPVPAAQSLHPSQPHQTHGAAQGTPPPPPRSPPAPVSRLNKAAVLQVQPRPVRSKESSPAAHAAAQSPLRSLETESPDSAPSFPC